MPRTSLRPTRQHPAGSRALTLEDVQNNDRFLYFKDGEGEPSYGRIRAILEKDGDIVVLFYLDGEPKERPAWLLGLVPCPEGDWCPTYITNTKRS
jgi:hypothetical protein